MYIYIYILDFIFDKKLFSYDVVIALYFSDPALLNIIIMIFLYKRIYKKKFNNNNKRKGKNKKK